MTDLPASIRLTTPTGDHATVTIRRARPADGSGVRIWLMSRYPSSMVAPFSMLVPVAGMASSSLLLGEFTFAVELVHGVVVGAGVLLASGSAVPVQHAAEPSTVDTARRIPAARLPSHVAGR